MQRTRDAVTIRTKLFRGLADPSRLAILEGLRDGRRTVSQVVERTGLSQPNASMHLNCLWCCGLVEREMVGRFTFYWVGSKRVKALLDAAVALMGEVAERIEECKRYEELKENG